MFRRQIVDDDLLILLFVHAVRECRRVGSFKMRSTFSPAISPAFFVAWRCESSKYAGTVITLGDLLSKLRFGIGFELAQNEPEISSGENHLSPIFTSTPPVAPARISYGNHALSRCTSGSVNLRPIRRFTERWYSWDSSRLPFCEQATSRSPLFESATIEASCDCPRHSPKSATRRSS